jgi:hypothetical protein
MTAEMPTNPEIEPIASETLDEQKLFSSDPYEVLGVAPDAEMSQIKEARNELVQEFHPDVSKHPRAHEITQNINLAFQNIKAGSGNRTEQKGPSSTDESVAGSPVEGFVSADEIRREDFQSDFFRAIRSPKQFREFWLEAQSQGWQWKQVTELINTYEAEDLIVSDFVTMIEVSDDDNSDKCLAYIGEWKKLGINLDKLVTLEPVLKRLKDVAVNVKIKIQGEDNPERLLLFIDSWKKAGVDLSYVVNTPEARAALEHIALTYKVKIRGADGNAEHFLDFVEAWKAAGVDLTYVLNLKLTNEFLEETTRSVRRIDGIPLSRRFVSNWQEAGWVPSQEFLRLESEVKSYHA